MSFCAQPLKDPSAHRQSAQELPGEGKRRKGLLIHKNPNLKVHVRNFWCASLLPKPPVPEVLPLPDGRTGLSIAGAIPAESSKKVNRAQDPEPMQ